MFDSVTFSRHIFLTNDALERYRNSGEGGGFLERGKVMVAKTIRFERIEQVAAMLVLPGILLTVLTDGQLSGGVTKAMLAVLLVLDLLMIHWLIERQSGNAQ
jgi:hypothetical protein